MGELVHSGILVFLGFLDGWFRLWFCSCFFVPVCLLDCACCYVFALIPNPSPRGEGPPVRLFLRLYLVLFGAIGLARREPRAPTFQIPKVLKQILRASE